MSQHGVGIDGSDLEFKVKLSAHHREGVSMWAASGWRAKDGDTVNLSSTSICHFLLLGFTHLLSALTCNPGLLWRLFSCTETSSWFSGSGVSACNSYFADRHPNVLLLLLLSRFSRFRLCNPIDGSPAGSAIPGILQARTLEWVAISFSNAWKWKVDVKSLSRVRLLATQWTAAHQAPASMGFFRQEDWSELLLSSPQMS